MKDVDFASLKLAIEEMNHGHLAEVVVNFLYRNGWSPTRVRHLVEQMEDLASCGNLTKMSFPE